MEDTRMKGYLKKKNLRSGLWVTFWVEHDIIHDDINYFTENTSLGPQVSRLRGHFSLEGATFKAEISKKDTPKLIVQRKSGRPVKWATPSLEEAEAWVRHLNSTRELPNNVQQLLTEWKKAKDLTRCIAKNEEELEMLAKKEYTTLVDFDDDDFDPTLDLPSLTVVDSEGKRVTIDSIAGMRVTILLLIRNFGCVMGKQLAGKIWNKVDTLEQVGVQLIAVGSGSPEGASKWKKETNFPGSVYCDNDNVLVKTFSCKRGFKYLLSPRSLSAVQKALADGIRPGQLEGDQAYLGGTVVYSKRHGIIFQHLDRDLGDQSSIDQIIMSVWRFQRDHPDCTWATPSNMDFGVFTTQAAAGADGIVKPFRFERGNSYMNNEELPRLLDFAFYTKTFQNREHGLWVRKLPDDYSPEDETNTDSIGPVLIALVNESNGDYSCLIFTKCGARRRLVAAHRNFNEKECIKFLVANDLNAIISSSSSGSGNNSNGSINTSLVSSASIKEAPQVKMRKITNVGPVKSELLRQESQEGFSGYKFGILLAKEGDITEEDMYNGSDISTPLFDAFVSSLGEKVELAGRNGYMGGLDNKSSRTGTHSIFTVYDDANVMFHVSTMIPATANEKMIAQKRHLGNDMGLIVFKEGNDPIDVSAFRSQFNHFFIVIRPIQVYVTDQEIRGAGSKPAVHGYYYNRIVNGTLGANGLPIPTNAAVAATNANGGGSISPRPSPRPPRQEGEDQNEVAVVTRYSIEVVSKTGVPPAPPFLSDPPLFEMGPYMRQWLLAKLLNLERMTTDCVSIFRGKMEKVRLSGLWDITQIANGKKPANIPFEVPSTPDIVSPVITRRGSLVGRKPVIETKPPSLEKDKKKNPIIAVAPPSSLSKSRASESEIIVPIPSSSVKVRREKDKDKRKRGRSSSVLVDGSSSHSKSKDSTLSTKTAAGDESLSDSKDSESTSLSSSQPSRRSKEDRNGVSASSDSRRNITLSEPLSTRTASSVTASPLTMSSIHEDVSGTDVESAESTPRTISSALDENAYYTDPDEKLDLRKRPLPIPSGIVNPTVVQQPRNARSGSSGNMRPARAAPRRPSETSPNRHPIHRSTSVGHTKEHTKIIVSNGKGPNPHAESRNDMNQDEPETPQVPLEARASSPSKPLRGSTKRKSSMTSSPDKAKSRVKSTGYDSSSIEQVLTTFKVQEQTFLESREAHKNQFNNVKAKWKAIASSETTPHEPIRRLVTANSLSNLVQKRAVRSSNSSPTTPHK